MSHNLYFSYNSLELFGKVLLAYTLNNIAFDFKRALNSAALANTASASAVMRKHGCCDLHYTFFI